MIRLNNISFAYKKNPVFENFSLEINEGEATMITGINGSGKTTLLRLLAGVLFPEKGKIEYGQKMGENPRSKIGFISDQMNLYENMTLQDAIRFHSAVYNIKKFDPGIINKAKLNLNQKIGQLSAGQKLIFHLGLIMAAKPDVLLIDEIMHSMDVYLRETFLNHLLELIEEKQITLILVNLNYHDIEKIPQRVILMQNNMVSVDEQLDTLKSKVKKVVTTKEVSQLPILFHQQHADCHEYFVYPYEDGMGDKIGGKVIDLNLNDIIKAFIGGEYV